MPREKRCLDRIDAKREKMPRENRENRVEKSRMRFWCQAQYLVKLECDFSCQAQHLVTFWEIAGARICCIFQYKIVSKIGRVRSPKRRVRDDDFMVGLSSDCRRIVFLLAEAIHGVSTEVLNLQISWQAQYLVRLVADCACSAHCK